MKRISYVRKEEEGNEKFGVTGELVFFFQAEDGIRVAQESRGLGDVYMRRVWVWPLFPFPCCGGPCHLFLWCAE